MPPAGESTMRAAFLAVALAASAGFAQAPKSFDFTGGEEPKTPYTLKVDVEDRRNGNAVATYKSVHATFVSQNKPPQGAQRLYTMKIEHLGGGGVGEGSVITDMDKKQWRVFSVTIVPKKWVVAQATPIDGADPKLGGKK